MTLLTTGNPKVAKGTKAGFLTAILHLAPSTLSGYNTCPMATAGCAFACLNTAGRGGIFRKGETTNAIQTARIRKTVMFYEQRDTFMSQLYREVRNFVKLARKHGLTPAIRLNGTSDIRWETVPVTVQDGKENYVAANIMSVFPDVQFYDYQKRTRLTKDMPANYHLTFSRADGNDATAMRMLEAGENVAVVFSTAKGKPLPDTWNGYRVIDGDDTDLRFLDPKNVVVGLRAKGKARHDTSGFVVRV